MEEKTKRLAEIQNVYDQLNQQYTRIKTKLQYV